MNALMICDRLKQNISGRTLTGKVHSVFKGACNLVVDQQNMFITLLAGDRIMSPMCVMLDTNCNFSFRNLYLNQGEKFHMSMGEICFDGVRLSIHIENARVWQSVCEIPANEYQNAIDAANFAAFEECLFTHGRFSGIEKTFEELAARFSGLSLRMYEKSNGHDVPDRSNASSFAFILPKFVAFMQDYITADTVKLSESCSGVIGFGCGLTPSMDDFVNGLMLVNVYMSKFQKILTDKAIAFNIGMMQHSLDRTTRVSSEMLRYGAYGLANDAVKKLMLQLFCGTPKAVCDATRKALDYGQTSGTDTALGIYVGLMIWTNYDFRGNFI